MTDKLERVAQEIFGSQIFVLRASGLTRSLSLRDVLEIGYGEVAGHGKNHKEKLEKIHKEIAQAAIDECEPKWLPIDQAKKDATEYLIWSPGVNPQVGYFDKWTNKLPEGERPYFGWWSHSGEVAPEFPTWRDLEAVPARHQPTLFKHITHPEASDD